MIKCFKCDVCYMYIIERVLARITKSRALDDFNRPNAC